MCRQKLLLYLKRHLGSRLGIVTNLRGNALTDHLRASGVVVGDSYPAPHYWSNRIYETLGRGGFLIHPKTEGMDEEFEAGKHYVEFKRGDYKQLIRLINYYLEHTEEREAIRQAGFEHVKKHLTYTHRCQVLIDRIEDFKSQRNNE